MKVADIEAFVLRVPLAEAFGYSQAWYQTRTAMLVRVTADDGATGWCEAFGPPEPTAAIVRHVLAPLVVGADPFATLQLWERMYAATRDYGQKGLVLHAISALDVTLWDLKGRSLGLSVSRLLRG